MYLLNIGIAIDQLVNSALGGEPDETLSARAHRMRVNGHPYWGWTAQAINLLFFWQEDHCLLAHQAEIRRYQFPPAYRAMEARSTYYPPGSDPNDQ